VIAGTAGTAKLARGLCIQCL